MTEPKKAVFLSYASQDAAAALRICEAVRAAGIEVWFDQSELRGGDAWDAAIRRQIKACSLFMPVISASTCARVEGYFRLEWKLAVDRSYLIATETAFIVPVVIDGTKDSDALVPDRFREVQWTRLIDGATPAAFAERVSRLLSTAQSPAGSSLTAPTSAPIAAPSAQPFSAAPASAAAAAHSPAVSRSRVTWVVIALAAAAGYLAVDRFSAPRRSTQTEAASELPSPTTPAVQPNSPSPGINPISERSIAVLPFVNMSSDKEQEYFSDGLSEELIDLLTKVPDLRVPARTSSFFFKGKSETIPTIARELGVAHLLEGSVRRAGNRLRVTAQLIRADTGYDVWSETYDRELKDVFKVQDEIAGAVVAALKLKLPSAQNTSAHRTANTEAHNQYLLGLQSFNRRNVDGYGRAVDFYRKAIALDPNYAAGYAGLAFALTYLADTSGDAALLQQALAAAEKAVALAPEQADGYVARGYFRGSINFDWAGAQADLAKGLDLDAGDSTGRRRYAQLLGTLGRFPEAVAEARRAVELDPLSEPSWQTLARLLTASRDFAAAHEASRRALEINPESGYALSSLGQILLLEGKAAEAAAVFRRIDARSLFELFGVAMAEHTLGRARESQQALDELTGKGAENAAYQIAEVHAWRGEKDKAFEWLERAYRQRDGGLADIKYDPLLNSLHGDSRYAALLRKMNLPV